MRARRSGLAWEIHAPAKLNLYLDILGRRDDGFHELETLMTPVRIFDRLRWTPPDPSQPQPFALGYDPATPMELQRAAAADRNNLAWRAFDLLGRVAGIEPTGRVALFKRIPIQAGMGGASSDAAAALTLANAAWGIRYSPARLAELGAELGSDVPFFFAGGAAICRGRGERVAAVGGLPQLNVVVAKPPTGVSTPAAFAALNAPLVSTGAARDSQARLETLVDSLRSGALARASRLMVNRLEAAAVKLNPWIERLQQAFAGCSTAGRLMTGSGSAYFGIMRSARQARRVARQLSLQFSRFEEIGAGPSPSTAPFAMVFATSTCQAASPPL
jgi:4-diphosphocytidyl-2-C-methyl-D-erythritol kinase